MADNGAKDKQKRLSLVIGGPTSCAKWHMTAIQRSTFPRVTRVKCSFKRSRLQSFLTFQCWALPITVFWICRIIACSCRLAWFSSLYPEPVTASTCETTLFIFLEVIHWIENDRGKFALCQCFIHLVFGGPQHIGGMVHIATWQRRLELRKRQTLLTVHFVRPTAAKQDTLNRNTHGYIVKQPQFI